MRIDNPPTPRLHSPLFTLLKRPVVTASPATPLRDALLTMSEAKVDSIVVVSAVSNKPIGIFTLRDLLHRVAAQSCDLGIPVEAAMSRTGLVILDQRATIYRASLEMSRQGIHHIIVVSPAGGLAGVVSQQDIYELHSGGSAAIAGAIRGARDLDALIVAANDIRHLTRRALADGRGAESVTESISNLNDHLTARLIDLTRVEFSLPDVPWSWLAFGSEGRYEQTLSTDQDNGIVFAASPTDAHATRQQLLPFAAEVNRRLDACGFPLCKGNVMASNPDLCLSVDEWQQRFAKWLRSTTPQALLDSTIYFDFRSIYGEEALAVGLRDWINIHVPQSSLFLRFMAQDAMRTRPPLGIVKDFAYDRNIAFPLTIDLKANGTRLFVDAARILALANGIDATSTAGRLHAAAAKGKISDADASAMTRAFFVLQAMRLKAQSDATPAGIANRIAPNSLNELDRFVLKECLRQAKRLQRRIQLDYHL